MKPELITARLEKEMPSPFRSPALKVVIETTGGASITIVIKRITISARRELLRIERNGAIRFVLARPG